MMKAPVWRLLLLRSMSGLFSLFVVSVLIFLMIEALPGDFASSVLGINATPENVAVLERQLGLDRPPVERYFSWLAGALTGDFGNSFTSRLGVDRPVSAIIAPRLANTLFLAGMTALIAIPLAVVLGVLTARYRNSLFDRALNAGTLTTVSLPEFVVAYALVALLAVKFPIFPALTNISADMDFTTRLYRVALPMLTLVLVMTAHIMRMTRAAVIGVMAQPYIEMARLKGISGGRVVFFHALANAIGPIANVIAFNLAYLVVGVVVLETVFVFPGLGQTMVDALRTRDVPLIQACTLIFAAVYILVNLLADLVALVTNPRLMHPK